MGRALRIAGARLEEVVLAPVTPVRTGRGAAMEGERRSLVLRLDAGHGIEGRGEATPLPGWSPESVAQARRALSDLDWSEVTVDFDGEPLAQVASWVARIDAAAPSARFAAETALLEVVARALDLPLHRLLSPAGAATPVALSALLTAGPDGAVVEEARAAIARGARTLKWKVGRAGAFDAELATLRSLRAAVGDAVALRLDANGGFSDLEVEAQLSALAEVSPELVEEPSPGWLTATFTPPFPLAADESLARPGGEALVEAALRAGRCGAVVLKPMLLGGVLRCRAIADRARAQGASVIVTHSFDGPIALTAAAALALALGAPQAAAGLWPHPGLRAFGINAEDPGGALPFLDGGRIVPWDRPGLGLVWR